MAFCRKLPLWVTYLRHSRSFMPTVYRAIRRDDDGRPKLSNVMGWGLGIREGVDISADGEGVVHPGTGGMSVVPAIEHLRPHRLPAHLGGTGVDPVWALDTEELPEFLVYVPDPGDAPKHGLIEPAYAMELGDLEDALAGTRDLWRECG